MTHCLTRRVTKHLTRLNGRWRGFGSPANGWIRSRTRLPNGLRHMEDASILILTVQLMAEAGVGGKETTLPLLALAAGNLHR